MSASGRGGGVVGGERRNRGGGGREDEFGADIGHDETGMLLHNMEHHSGFGEGSSPQANDLQGGGSFLFLPSPWTSESVGPSSIAPSIGSIGNMGGAAAGMVGPPGGFLGASWGGAPNHALRTLVEESSGRPSASAGEVDDALSQVKMLREQVLLFFFVTRVIGPRRSLSLNLSDTRVYEPHIRARLLLWVLSPRTQPNLAVAKSHLRAGFLDCRSLEGADS